eukprot:420035_1
MAHMGHPYHDYAFEYAHDTNSWPSKNKAKAKMNTACNSKDCKVACVVFCSHCNKCYCLEHNDDHDYIWSKCNGIEFKWTVGLNEIANGAVRCGRTYSKYKNGTTIHIDCPKLSSCYCSHCKSFYCPQHHKDHRHYVLMCKGIKNGNIKAVK